MRIAIVGAGISGLGAALCLKDAHEVVLIEGAARAGGHANTLTIDYDGAPIAVDTGFIVYNVENYPHLTAMFDHLGVETYASDMSFAFSDAQGFEWSSNGLEGLFAWRRNLFRPSFVGMLADIWRFSKTARADLAAGTIGAGSLGDYVARLGLKGRFLDGYLLPMGAAIWSTPERDMLDYPAETFLRFFNNHRLLLQTDRPRWRTVRGGSQTYVQKAAAALPGRILIGDPVKALTRSPQGAVTLSFASGAAQSFDHVVLACHSDEALAILGAAASDAERALLSAVRYAPNVAYLHRDPGLMPKRRAAWASWNYLRVDADGGPVCVSYWMNRLQDIDRAKPLFVTLNPPRPPRADLTFAAIEYAHPQFDAAALSAQRAIASVQGVHGVSFAGAWLGYGFHEDGLASGVAAAERLGGRAPWAKTAPLPMREAA